VVAVKVRDVPELCHRYTDHHVKSIISNAGEIGSLPEDNLEIAFASNVFEHLLSKQQLFEVYCDIHQVLRKGRKLPIIQPTITYPYRGYWDFIDHFKPLTENSLDETLIIKIFKISECIPQSLPFSVSSSPSESRKLPSLYLKIPPLWRIFGRQQSVVGVKP
jgi:hypothetical protein